MREIDTADNELLMLGYLIINFGVLYMSNKAKSKARKSMYSLPLCSKLLGLQ